ncbi:sulfatase [Isosphaeraceae bacterium EP7]
MKDRILATIGHLPLVLILSLSASQAEARGPNVVLIFVDDQGYGDLGCYGGKGAPTPNLDKLAAQGRRFTNFHVPQPVCSASRAGLLTGCYPSRVGIQGALRADSRVGLAESEVTIAEMLRAGGYDTGMAGKWHLGRPTRFLPTHQGFDEYLGLPYSNDMWPGNPQLKQKDYPRLPLIEGDAVIDPEVTPEDQPTLTSRYTERAVAFLDRHKGSDRPFFFYLAHSMPHVPLHTSPAFHGKSGLGPYADVQMELDWSVGQVMVALERNGQADDTLLIYTSDNGPWLNYGDHGGSSGPLREGKGTCWEGGIRIPFIARWPGKLPAGTVSDDFLVTIDLAPTLAGLAGARLPEHPIDGLDVWPLLSGQPGATNPHDAYVFYYGKNELQAITSGDGRWKLQLPHTYQTLAGRPPGRDGKPARYEPKAIAAPELYDLKADPGETRDLAAANPDVVRHLLDLAERARVDLGDSLMDRVGNGLRPAGEEPAPAR